MKRILHGALICALLVVVSVALWPASVSAHPHATAISIYVRGDFADDEVNHKYNTIQKGINAARDNMGDKVYVYAGTYNENVYVSKRKLTLHGQSASLVTVNGGGSPYTIEIVADTVTVRQLTIEGGSVAGVRWVGVDRGTLEKCDLTDNTIGVLLQSITNQTVQCNNVYSNSSDGIQVNDSNLKDVIRNRTFANGNDGISLINSTTIVVARNKSYSNTRYGIYVGSGSSINDIYLNDFYGNTAGDGSSAGSGNNWETPSTPYYGNYWGDYAGSDGNLDGIGDTPHPLGSEQDDYPLMSPHANYEPAPQDEPAQCTPEQAPPSPPGDGDGGGCFIATAAYGSYLDSHVETLRNFRDSYMLTNPVGSALVSAYYKLSPPVADFIDDNPTLKPIVRTALLPAVAMSTVAVNTTSAEKIAIVGSLALVSVALAAWARKRRGKGFTM